LLPAGAFGTVQDTVVGGMSEKLQCQKKGCRSRANWFIVPNLEGKPVDEDDILQKPIGFCTIDHLLEFFAYEYWDWSFNKKREYKRMRAR
jgi:hypothetical protein